MKVKSVKPFPLSRGEVATLTGSITIGTELEHR